MSSNHINLRSLVGSLAVVSLIAFSSSLLNGCESSSQSDSYSPGTSTQDMLDFSRRERSETGKFLRRINKESERKMQGANRRCNNGDQAACDEVNQMLQNRVRGEELGTRYMQRRARDWGE